MTPGGDQPADGAPIWMKYLGKGAGVVGGGGEHENHCFFPSKFRGTQRFCLIFWGFPEK